MILYLSDTLHTDAKEITPGRAHFKSPNRTPPQDGTTGTF